MELTKAGTAGLEAAATPSMPDRVRALQVELAKLPQYEPRTVHRFHGGMYQREVFRHAEVTIVGKVHKKEHFYVIVFGTVHVTTDEGVQRIIGPATLQSMPGTKRAVYAETDALCMTFHRLDAMSVEQAEDELVEAEESAFGPGNLLKNSKSEVLS